MMDGVEVWEEVRVDGNGVAEEEVEIVEVSVEVMPLFDSQ